MGNLDGNKPLQLFIVGLVDQAKAALAEDFFDAIATDILRD